MSEQHYALRYLPAAREDLYGLMLYIADVLHAPKSALLIAEKLEEAIARLEEFPYAFPAYRLVKPLKTEYRMLPVENYHIFYTVIEPKKLVEVHRILYAKMDLTQEL
ncbi:MAG: type II toxin-antitoxin system RelE/ParE family toxin [Christensenellaceae bacterium]|jgi:plasmid stabilization system protein ParE|nr:type II toxin-antitoxin system RelE/ParE family toxin [Christensenellaceae bacterium]